jgi:uncharacterized delta-60 repeat protein
MHHSESACSSKLRIIPRLPLVAVLAGVLLLPPAGIAATGDPDAFLSQLDATINYSAAVQPDGKFLLGGNFTRNGNTTLFCSARFTAAGVLDAFNPNVSAMVYCTTVQDDGKIWLGGIFSNVGGVARNRFARVNADGTLDAAYDPASDSIVNCVLPQADGRILIGGEFSSVGGVSRPRIARLNSDGTVDTNFTAQMAGTVNCIALQTDGRILIGGLFGTVNATPRKNIGRLNADGTLDMGFNPGANNEVNCLSVQADGRILVGGAFTNLAGSARNYIGRLNADGTLDTNFNPNASSRVNTVVLQADGKILLGGAFTNLAGASRNLIARLDTNGVPDPAFAPVFTPITLPYEAFGLALQADGKVLAVGQLLLVNGVVKGAVARLENDAATQSLTVPATNRVHWLRGGSAPEAQHVAFELSTNGGATYTLLGTGTRISGGWELTGLSLPSGGAIRARARTTGGRNNGSSGLIETISSFGPLVAFGLSAAETYLEDIPLNLADIVVISGNPPGITATLTLSIPAAGSLSTATSGVVIATYVPATGVWSATGPVMDVNALLSGVTFKPATNFNQSFIIATSLSDGVTTLSGSKVVTGISINDAPTLAFIGNPPAIPEDPALAYGVSLTGISDGGGEGQPLTITATSDNTNLIAGFTVNYISPNPSGSLTYRPVTNANGSVNITVTIDDGGLSNNITTRIFTITVLPVNDPPSFTKGPNKSHPFGTSTAQAFVGWATSIDDGDASVTQALTFIVTNSNPGLFTTGPSVTANGTLTYTPNGTNGVATLGISLRDDATAGGVALTTPVQMFTITVDPPSAQPPPVLDRQSLKILGDGSFQFSFTNTNNLAFSVLAATNVTLPRSNWMVLGVATNIGGGRHGFTDPQATNSRNRFYLLRAP